MSEHIETKRRLKDIEAIDDFKSLINRSTLCDEDKLILSMIYLQSKPLDFIADDLGWSYVTIKRRHAKAVRKLKPLILTIK